MSLVVVGALVTLGPHRLVVFILHFKLLHDFSRPYFLDGIALLLLLILLLSFTLLATLSLGILLGVLFLLLFALIVVVIFLLIGVYWRGVI